MKKVESLKKISLKLEAGTTAEHMDLTPKALEFTFIFGIGPEGMCPFEYQLVNRDEQEIVLLHLKKQEFGIFSGHLQLPILNLFAEYESLYLKVKISRIQQPDSKEVVKALADLASHPGGCACGCGC